MVLTEKQLQLPPLCLSVSIMKKTVATSFLFGLCVVVSGASAETHSASSVENNSNSSVSSVDPWQSYNRAMFSFNTQADRFLTKPIAKTYVRLTPDFFRRGVDNVFSNIGEVPSALNGVLQGNFSSAVKDTGRLLVNSTIGVAGLFDVAQYMGLPNTPAEDFGQTLAIWGVESGPYVVLPFLGSSTLRDTASLPVDWFTDPKSYIDHVPTSNTVRATSLINTRANFLELEKSLTGDKYVFVREAYLQHRNFSINNGVVEDSFGEEVDE